MDNHLITGHLKEFWGASRVALVVKNSPANAGNSRDMGSIPGWGRSLEKGMAAHCTGEFCVQRSLLGYSPYGRKESDVNEATEHAKDFFFFFLSKGLLNTPLYLSLLFLLGTDILIITKM